jgi:hypothetical protein
MNAECARVEIQQMRCSYAWRCMASAFVLCPVLVHRCGARGCTLAPLSPAALLCAAPAAPAWPSLSSRPDLHACPGRGTETGLRKLPKQGARLGAIGNRQAHRGEASVLVAMYVGAGRPKLVAGAPS